MFNPLITDEQASEFEKVICSKANREAVKGMKDEDFNIFKKGEEDGTKN